MEFTKAGNGEDELMFDGYLHRIGRRKGKPMPEECFWTCSQAKQHSCKAYLRTDKAKQTILSYCCHNHRRIKAVSKVKDPDSPFPNSDKEIEIITNNKGGKKLTHDGHMYTKKYDLNNCIQWECSSKSLYKCKGTLATDVACKKITGFHIHSHKRNIHQVEAAKVKLKIKKAAFEGSASADQIIDSIFSKVSSKAIAKLGRRESNKRLVRRHQQKPLPVDSEILELQKFAETIIARWETFDAKWAKFEEKEANILNKRFKPY